jgi:hypothetical protein|tara:strand:+ start:49 stop:384 length:336 start_codon:yes stop_codon:yes gene_type:complete
MKTFIAIIITVMFTFNAKAENTAINTTDPQASRYTYNSILCQAHRKLISPVFELGHDFSRNSMVCYATQYSIRQANERIGVVRVYEFTEEYTRATVIAAFVGEKLFSVTKY